MARVAPTQQHHAPSHVDSVKVVSSLIAFVGAYMLLSAWKRDLDIGNQLNALVAGAVACALGVAINRNAPGLWASWVVALVGAWFIISPWLYRYVGDVWTWHSLLAGVILLVLGIWCSRNAPFRHHGRVVRRRRSPSGHS